MGVRLLGGLAEGLLELTALLAGLAGVLVLHAATRPP